MFKVVEFKANGTSYFIEKSIADIVICDCISLIDCWNKSKHLICVEDLKQLVFIPKKILDDDVYTELTDVNKMCEELQECIKNLLYQIPKIGRLNMPIHHTNSVISVCYKTKINTVYSWTHFWMMYYLHCLEEESKIKDIPEDDGYDQRMKEEIFYDLEKNKHYCFIECSIDEGYNIEIIQELREISVIEVREPCQCSNRLYLKSLNDEELLEFISEIKEYGDESDLIRLLKNLEAIQRKI